MDGRTESDPLAVKQIRKKAAVKRQLLFYTRLFFCFLRLSKNKCSYMKMVKNKIYGRKCKNQRNYRRKNVRNSAKYWKKPCKTYKNVLQICNVHIIIFTCWWSDNT